MKKLSAALVILATLMVLPARSENARELSWEDLAPQIEFEDPYRGLTPEQVADFSLVYWMIQRQQVGPEMSEAERIPLEAQYRESVSALEASGFDIDSAIAKQDEINERQRLADRSVVAELNTLNVKIPGYALPLEYSDDNRVTEFLLVPYVGACIHVPPPPPNQIVHVQSERGIEINSLFEPVWVSGRLTTQQTEQDLSFVDGAASIDVGYALEANLIEAYTE
ncbi:DUF3299 domain-containing protein [Synechococcus sp. PCC 7336]|uniref:DUF3299 domain-containing protein n=1 Tax=Synechococcus sp. PCC 7336 TaxID=195250 RepID=UPI0003491D6B|nr:DUF3299 domain-containing protein [Synechococcus sp. PCC 7336]